MRKEAGKMLTLKASFSIPWGIFYSCTPLTLPAEPLMQYPFMPTGEGRGRSWVLGLKSCA